MLQFFCPRTLIPPISACSFFQSLRIIWRFFLFLYVKPVHPCQLNLNSLFSSSRFLPFFTYNSSFLPDFFRKFCSQLIAVLPFLFFSSLILPILTYNSTFSPDFLRKFRSQLIAAPHFLCSSSRFLPILTYNSTILFDFIRNHSSQLTAVLHFLYSTSTARTFT